MTYSSGVPSMNGREYKEEVLAMISILELTFFFVFCLISIVNIEDVFVT